MGERSLLCVTGGTTDDVVINPWDLQLKNIR